MLKISCFPKNVVYFVYFDSNAELNIFVFLAPQPFWTRSKTPTIALFWRIC